MGRYGAAPSPLELIASSATAAASGPRGSLGRGGWGVPAESTSQTVAPANARGDIHADPAIEQRQRDIVDWLNGVPQQREADAQALIKDTELGARAQRARQRAFSSMAGARSGFDSTIHTSPLGLASSPMGKGKLGA